MQRDAAVPAGVAWTCRGSGRSQRLTKLTICGHTLGHLAFAINWKRVTIGHLEAIEPKHHGTIRDVVEEQLSREPSTETRNRKPLQGSVALGSDVWELRFGTGNRFRVFYTADPAVGTVEVLAVGVKERNKLRIGGREAQL